MNKTIKTLVAISMGSLIITVAAVLSASALIVKRGVEANRESSTVAHFGSISQTDGTVTELSSAQVAAHNTSADCWMIISGNVYNVTTFLPAHPGGALTMTPYCGREATLPFDTKDKKPGVKHSSTAVSMLAQYYLGALGSKIVSGGSGTGSTGTQQKSSGLASLFSSVKEVIAPLLGNKPAASTTTTLTTSVVASHNTPSNCWIVVSGAAYDVTGYLAQHPGGVYVITPYCGKDATNAFKTKDKGSSHSQAAYDQLARYFVGNIGSVVTSVNTGIASSGLTTATPFPTLPPGVSATATPTPLPVAQSGYTTAQISSHTTSSNCWLIISGKVYNVTNYLTQHPGGVNVITPYCGKEATGAFSTKGGNGSNHSSYAYSLLNLYYIGNVVTGGVAVTPTPTPFTNTPAQTIAPTPTPTPLPVTSSGYTTADVVGHNTSSNCWIIISNKVYNVTSYLTRHPGGVSVITKYCGKDSTGAFQTKDGRGSNHSTNAYNQLASYYIGDIVSATVPTTAPGQPTPTPIPGQTAATPTPTTAATGGNYCTIGVLPDSVSAKYPGATIKSQSVEDNCSQELEINYNGSCRHIKTNSTGDISSDQSC